MFTHEPPAKLNLTLEVGLRAEDGYHPLRSIFVTIGLVDGLAVSEARAADRDVLEVRGLPGCPVEGNLVLRAFELVRQRAGVALPPLRARLEKNIPLGAGLGGGSSDAAGALLLALACWGIGLAPAELDEIALALGSDVPFFAAGHRAALVEGRGERLSPLPSPAGEGGVLLAVSAAALPTGLVYDRFDRLSQGVARLDAVAGGSPSDRLAEALEAGLSGARLAELASGLRDANDLWPAATSLAPYLAPRRAALEQLTGRAWLLSGSGPTLFCLYASLADAIAAGERLVAEPRDADSAAQLAGVILYATDLEHSRGTWRKAWPAEH